MRMLSRTQDTPDLARDESHGRYPNTQEFGEVQIGMFNDCYRNDGGTNHAQ